MSSLEVDFEVFHRPVNIVNSCPKFSVPPNFWVSLLFFYSAGIELSINACK